ncbi:immunoglobulin-like domain protein [Finch poxvirus]|uniref:Immunoglobulin-like domain protein n=1 Tax=Condorpox virus TaxID=3049970 RepID=A0AAT9UPQ1_9POXV|nr:immunoglobulin-like domain protein [Finch poxvirus]UOX39142.1 immunoglobulin-like domain protein [Finch poxvirus]
MYKISQILIILSFFYSAVTINVNVRNNKELKVDCILESGKLADRLLFYSVKDNKENHLLVNISINNSGNDTCYCGNPNKYYTVIYKNSSRYDEGSYICLFLSSGNETYKHTVDVRVMPVVITTSYFKDNLVYSVCNVTAPLDRKNIEVHFIIGGIKTHSSFLEVLTRRPVVAHWPYFDYYVKTDLRYPDSVKEVICQVEYYGLLDKYRISTDIVNISDSEKFINETLLTYKTEKNPFSYDLKKFDNYTLPGESVSLECNFELLYNETIDKIVWSDDDPYAPEIIVIDKETIHYKRTGFYLSTDFIAYDDYDDSDNDISNTIMVITNPKIDNSKCYNVKATMGRYSQECKKCLLVGDQVFFEWRELPENKVMIICYIGTHGLPGTTWRIGGTRIAANKYTGSGSIYGECKKCIGSSIIIDKNDKSAISVPYCTNWMARRYAKEYPIDYASKQQYKLYELKKYRISNE